MRSLLSYSQCCWIPQDMEHSYWTSVASSYSVQKFGNHWLAAAWIQQFFFSNIFSFWKYIVRLYNHSISVFFLKTENSTNASKIWNIHPKINVTSAWCEQANNEIKCCVKLYVAAAYIIFNFIVSCNLLEARIMDGL